jgi:hypothetical protein
MRIMETGEKTERIFEKKYCTICGRECGIKGVSPSQLCLECFKKENEIKGFHYYKVKILTVLFVFFMPTGFIILFSKRLYDSFKKGVFTNIWGKIGYMVVIFLLLVSIIGLQKEMKDYTKK